MLRRRLLAAGLALAAAPAARAQKPSGAGPLRLGVDHALVESGLGLQPADGVQRRHRHRRQAGRRPALAVLEATGGELDAALTNAPAAEAALEKQRLVHDRQPIAGGDFVIVGPAPRGRGQERPRAGRSAAEVLTRIRDLAAGHARQPRLPVRRRRLGHARRRAGALARRRHRAGGAVVRGRRRLGRLRRKVRARGAYAVVERGAWAVGGGGLAVLADGDPLLAEAVHAMRAFRTTIRPARSSSPGSAAAAACVVARTRLPPAA